ncbi:hypothetical protein Tco_1320591 [Tanacetum coccineum]
MSNSNTHQQSLVDAGYETRPPMLETGSYIPWASHFRRNSGNDGRITRRSYVQEEVIEGNNVQNDARNIQRTLRTTSLGTTANVQCYNCSEKCHYACNCQKLTVRDSKYFMEQMLLTKQDEEGVTLIDEQNDFLYADATQMEEIKELSANICLMARIQSTNINSDAGPSYDYEFLSEVQTPSTSYVNPLFAKDNQEQKYLKQPKIINNTIGDDQIDSNITFDEPNVDVNSGSVEHDNNVQASYALEQLALNAYKEAEKQQINADKTSPNKQKAVATNNNVIAPGMYKVNTKKKQEITTNKTKSVLSSIGLIDASSVRGQSSRDSSFKNSVLANTKKSSEKVEVSNRINKKPDVASKNVVLNKTIVTDVDVKNALKAKDVLCVSCAKNVLIPCYVKCLANYKLNVHSKVRRALFATPGIVKSKFKDTTPVVSKTRFSVKTTQSKSLDTTTVVSKTKIVAVTLLSAKNKVVQIVLWIVDSGCSKHMTGDRTLLENFIEKFMGTVRFGNDHFEAITGYGDYVQGNITVFHVYYVEGLGHNLFSVGQLCDGDLEVAFRSKTCYV